MNLENLIDALFILSEYNKDETPLQCGHDHIGVIVDREANDKDKAKLSELGFHYAPDREAYVSYKYEWKSKQS